MKTVRKTLLACAATALVGATLFACGSSAAPEPPPPPAQLESQASAPTTAQEQPPIAAAVQAAPVADRGSGYRKRATDGSGNDGSRGRDSFANRRGDEPSGGDRSASVGGSHHSGSSYGATRHCAGGGYGYARPGTDGHPGAGGGYRDRRGRNASGVYHDPC